MNANLRKAEVNLTTLGTGVIFFGAWTFLKIVLTMYLYYKQFEELYSEGVLLIINIVVWVIAGLGFLTQFYIGMTARAEGKGKRKTRFYLILTGAVVFFSVLVLAAEGYLLFTGDYSIGNIVITLLIDVTSLVIHFELLVNAVKTRKLRKKEAQA